MPRRRLALAAVAAAVLLVATQLFARVARLLADGPRPQGELAALPLGATLEPADRTAEAYAGQGAWVDVYDFVPALQTGGAEPAVTPDDVRDMAVLGVDTLYLQAARERVGEDRRVVAPDVVGEFLDRAHALGMRVVGWYLPRFGDVDADLAHLVAISEFEADGHRFDGVAVDIEWTETTPDHAERSARLVDLSRQLREEVGEDALGAIVLPPVQIEDVNPRLWPDFPWRDLAPYYDAWLTMGYWTVRSAESGLNDGYVYTAENVRRVRANLEDEGAVVHAVGGLAEAMAPEDVDRFAQALEETGADGGSLYDWSTTNEATRERAGDLLGG